jgi:hypothetical protein
MAGRSQLPVQIMENQTRYDLNAAVENWRNELAAQPNLASDDRRELETHLRDAIAGFQQRGLNDEESFWLARRRVGQPPQLGEEFIKANPTSVGRERIFWMMIALLIIDFWGDTSGLVADVLRTLFPNLIWLRDVPYSDAVELLLFSLPLLALIIFLAHGRIPRIISRPILFLKSRIYFGFTATAICLILEICSISVTWHDARLHHAEQGLLVSMSLTAILPLTTIALATWLMPPQNQKTPKRA